MADFSGLASVIAAVGSTITAFLLVMRELRLRHSLRVNVEFTFGAVRDEGDYRYLLYGALHNGNTRVHLLDVRLRFPAAGHQRQIDVGAARWLEPGESLPFSVDLLRLMKGFAESTQITDADGLRTALRDVVVVARDGDGEHKGRPSKDDRRRFDEFMRETLNRKPSAAVAP